MDIVNPMKYFAKNSQEIPKIVESSQETIINNSTHNLKKHYTDFSCSKKLKINTNILEPTCSAFEHKFNKEQSHDFDQKKVETIKHQDINPELKKPSSSIKKNEINPKMVLTPNIANFDSNTPAFLF